MTRLTDADRLFGELCDHIEEDEDTERAWVDIEAIVQVFNHAPTVDAVPIKWLYEQSDNPDRSDRFRNACDLVAMTWLEERKEE